MSEATNGSQATNGTATTVVDRAQSLLSHFGSRVQSAGAKIQDAATHLPESSAAAVSEAAPATERAEQTLDRAGEQIGVFAVSLSHRLRKAVALVREEAEDMLAEAQSLRRKEVS